jgi:hypothetical protein
VELTTPTNGKDQDVVMKDSKKAKSVQNSSDRKFSAQSNMSTDFMSSIHSNSGDRNKEENKNNYQ